MFLSIYFRKSCTILFSSHRIRSCIQAGRVTLVLGLPWQEGYPGTRTFLLIFDDALFTRQLWSPWCLVNALLGTTFLPGTTLFWLKKAQYDDNTDKTSDYDPENIKFFHNLSYFLFGSKLFSSFVICLCFTYKVTEVQQASSVLRQ